MGGGLVGDFELAEDVFDGFHVEYLVLPFPNFRFSFLCLAACLIGLSILIGPAFGTTNGASGPFALRLAMACSMGVCGS